MIIETVLLIVILTFGLWFCAVPMGYATVAATAGETVSYRRP
jgi:hypothetical protein